MNMMILAFAAITRFMYPDADSVTVDDIESVRYNPNGTYEQTEETWTKILTEKGRREESSVRLDYSKRYGEAAIDYVGAIDSNGVERVIDVSATMKEATDNGAMSVNIYDPLDRVISCTIPGLKIGETVHLKTHRKTTKPRCEGKWADLSIMEWTHPIVRATYKVTAPKELPIRKMAIRHPLGNITTNITQNADGSTTYVFTAADSAQVFAEPDMPPLYTQVQHVRVSTSENWQEISKWYWKLSVPHLVKTNAALVAKAQELKSVRAIFKFVSQEIRYMGLTMEDTSPGYAPHDVDITFNDRYGVCRDKAGLLVAMLRAAGHKAFPVLIHVGAKLDEEVPQPFFNHAIVAVDRGERDYELMDPTNENTKDYFPAYLCNCSYLVCRDEGEGLRLSPVQDPKTNELRVKSDGALKKDGSIFLNSRITMNGINDTAYRNAMVKMKPEMRVKFFERLVKAISPGAELARCRIEPEDLRDTEAPLAIEISATFPEMLLRGETRCELTVPMLTRALGVVNFLLAGNTALVQRKYPLKLDTTARVAEEIALELGDAVGAAKIVPTIEPVSGGFEYALNYQVTNNTLRVTRENALAAVEFDPEAYGELREQLKTVEAMERKRVAFAEDSLADADVCFKLADTETTLFSERSWVVTNMVVKKVLTYNGKKKSAELKFSYNPLWKHTEVISAVVSNRDGRVVSVMPKEINVMDAGWVSGAPRYAASKLLVVNLPAVEIGSVISYTTVTTVSNAPAGFYAEYDFDAHEPVECKIVRVNGWKREVVKPRRLKNEPNQPMAEFWRDHVVIASNHFEKFDLAIGPGLEDCTLKDMRAIRDWMAKYVKVVGPSFYELPLSAQLTDPQQVLKERYATRLDYVRTMCALLRGAGYEADVVLATSDADDPQSVRERIKFTAPNVRAFSAALCRVRIKEGGWLGMGGKTTEYFLGTENQYAEIGATAYAGSDYYDPQTGDFGVVTVPRSDLADYKEERSVYTVREDGAVDLDVENTIAGSEVAVFRKTYSEILPEERFRRYQGVLGGVAQAATATSELNTDVESHPAKRTFSCYVPDYATVFGDSVTLQLPLFVSSIPRLVGIARQTPFAIGAAEVEAEEVTVKFPKGYTKVEHLPENFALADPTDATKVWMTQTVSSQVVEGALVVKISRKVNRRLYAWYPAEYFELIKDYYRIATSRANRTLMVHK